MKCYTFHGSIIYIYATGSDTLIDVGTIPEGLGIFCAETPWRLSPRVAVSEGLSEEGIKVLEMLLRVEGHNRVDVEVDALEDYFTSGKEPMIPTAAPFQAEETPNNHQWTNDNHPLEQTRVSRKRSSRRRRVPKLVQLPRVR